jgi:hypothetical protein
MELKINGKIKRKMDQSKGGKNKGKKMKLKRKIHGMTKGQVLRDYCTNMVCKSEDVVQCKGIALATGVIGHACGP